MAASASATKRAASIPSPGSTRSSRWWGTAARSSAVGFAVPTSSPRTTCCESAFTISPPSRRASATARAVLPDAVGPTRTRSKSTSTSRTRIASRKQLLHDGGYLRHEGVDVLRELIDHPRPGCALGTGELEGEDDPLLSPLDRARDAPIRAPERIDPAQAFVGLALAERHRRLRQRRRGLHVRWADHLGMRHFRERRADPLLDHRGERCGDGRGEGAHPHFATAADLAGRSGVAAACFPGLRSTPSSSCTCARRKFEASFAYPRSIFAMTPSRRTMKTDGSGACSPR